jgi:hypothetical protein
VPVKTIPQQVLVSLHRFRSGWIAARTAQINTLRGLLCELGLVIPLGQEKVVPGVRTLIEDAESGIPDALRGVLAAACEEIEALSKPCRGAPASLRAVEALCWCERATPKVSGLRPSLTNASPPRGLGKFRGSAPARPLIVGGPSSADPGPGDAGGDPAPDRARCRGNGRAQRPRQRR